MGDYVPAGLRTRTPPPSETPREIMAGVVASVLIQHVQVKLQPLSPPEQVAVVQRHIAGQPLLNIGKVREALDLLEDELWNSHCDVSKDHVPIQSSIC